MPDDLDVRIRELVARAVADAPAAPELDPAVSPIEPAPSRRGWWIGGGAALLAAAALVATFVLVGPSDDTVTTPATNPATNPTTTVPAPTTSAPVVVPPTTAAPAAPAGQAWIATAGPAGVVLRDAAGTTVRTLDEPMAIALPLADGRVIVQRVSDPFEDRRPHATGVGARRIARRVAPRHRVVRTGDAARRRPRRRGDDAAVQPDHRSGHPRPGSRGADGRHARRARLRPLHRHRRDRRVGVRHEPPAPVVERVDRRPAVGRGQQRAAVPHGPRLVRRAHRARHLAGVVRPAGVVSRLRRDVPTAVHGVAGRDRGVVAGRRRAHVPGRGDGSRCPRALRHGRSRGAGLR